MVSKDFLLFKTIFDQTPVSTQIFSPDGMTVLVNKAWEKLWRASPKHVVNRYNILHDTQLEEAGTMPYIRRGFAGEAVTIPAIKYVPSKTVRNKKFVPYRWVQAKIYPIRDKNKHISHVVLQHEDITDRKESEEGLYKLASIIEYSTDAIVSKTLDGIITSWNKGAEELFGYTESEVIGKPIELIIPKHLRHEEVEIRKRISKGLPIEHYETTRIHKNGSEVYVSLNISPIKNMKGQVIGASKIARNISEKRKGEQARRESEERFRILTSHAPVGIFMTDEQGEVIFVNKKLLEFSGLSEKEVRGTGWMTALHPEDKVRIRKEWRSAIKKQRDFTFEFRSLTKSGTVGRFTGMAIVLRDDNKQFKGYMGTVSDITERYTFEKSLRESEERLRLALEAGKIGVWDWDIQNNALTWTENIYTLHGVAQKDFVVSLTNFLKLIHPDDTTRVKREIENSLSQKKPFSSEFRILTPQGESKWASMSTTLSLDGKNRPIRLLGAIIDISEQKQLEQDKSDFLSMASHELKTPLTSMKIFIDLLESELEASTHEKQKYFVSRIHDQANRLTELTSDLLDVSRIETGKLRLNKEVFNLEEMVTDTVESMQLSAKAHTLIVKKKSPVVVYADRYRLYQVLLNLLTNAVKYSPRGENIIVTVKKRKQDAIVSVRDYGIGIKKNRQNRIFEKLYQVADPEEKTFPGLGLGLYISKEIIERHKGKIWVESQGKNQPKIKRGSRFSFSLPLHIDKKTL